MRDPDETAETTSAEAMELVRLRVALADKEAQLAAALEAARMATWQRDLNTGHTSASESMARLWGLQSDQIFATDAQDYQLLHPEDREPHRARVRSAIESGGSWQAEFRAIRPLDGRIAWLEERGRVRTDPISGERVVEGLIWDITERKLAEAALRESDARKSFLLDLDDALRPFADPVRVQFEAARVLARHVGAFQSYYTDPHGDLASPVPENADFHAKQYWVTDTGVSHSLSADARAAYQVLGLRAFASAPVIKEGKLAWTLNVVSSGPRDWTPEEISLIKEVAERTWAATERAKAEAALRDSEERFRAFAAASTDILWVCNARTMKLEFVSSAFEEVFGPPPPWQAIDGNSLRRWARFVDPQDLPRVFDAMRRVRAGERVTHEYRIIRPFDREVRWIRDTDFPFIAYGRKVERFGGIAQDITQEKLASERLRVLVRELQHRTRNQIAVMRSLSDRTLSESESLQQYRVRYGERLAAAARVQLLLSRVTEREQVAFDELLCTELSAHGAPLERIFLEGPAGVRLRSSTIQTLALALHELATNAVKYGAIRSPEGQLHVGWHVTGNDDGTQQMLCIDWRETGIDTAHLELDLQYQGYGRELIESALPYQLGAKTTYEIGPQSVHCTIEIPISGSSPAGEP